jgi:hypothetical protein
MADLGKASANAAMNCCLRQEPMPKKAKKPPCGGSSHFFGKMNQRE